MIVGQKITQDDINLKLFQELQKLETRTNWSIALQATMSIATLVIMISIAGYTINLISKVG